MAKAEEKKEEKKEKFGVGDIATQTERVVIDNETGKVQYADLMESHAAIHNKLDKLMKLLD